MQENTPEIPCGFPRGFLVWVSAAQCWAVGHSRIGPHGDELYGTALSPAWLCPSMGCPLLPPSPRSLTPPAWGSVGGGSVGNALEMLEHHWECIEVSVLGRKGVFTGAALPPPSPPLQGRGPRCDATHCMERKGEEKAFCRRNGRGTTSACWAVTSPRKM